RLTSVGGDSRELPEGATKVTRDGVRARRVAIQVDRRCHVCMYRERRRDPLLGREQAGQVPVDLAYEAVCAGRVDAVTICRRRLRSHEVVTFLYGEDKKGVALVDAGGGEPVKELAERLVIVFQRSLFYRV